MVIGEECGSLTCRAIGSSSFLVASCPLLCTSYVRCDITTDAFWARVGGRRNLTDETISALLDPLRLVYGADVVGTPIATYATELHTDANMGYGAYANWRLGYSFTDYAHFYGVEQLVPYCDHNGCNSLQEWILLFSGSHTCYEHAETVHGAFFAGQRSANYALSGLGYPVETAGSRCDESWFWLTQ
jgi:Flavin containing amine oxidoreductase